MHRNLWILLCLAAATSDAVGLQSAEPSQWPIELNVGRFEIHADFDVRSATALPSELAGLAADVTNVLGITASPQPVHIVLFASGEEYRRYMHNYFPLLPERRALFIQDRGPGMLFTHWHTDVATDLRHEITHALLNDGPCPLPLWLDEGLAEYFEVERTQRFQGNAYLTQVSQRAQAGLVPSLSQLETIGDLEQFKDTQYRDSWAWVHFLIHRSATTRQLLVRYLSEHRSGSTQLALSRQLPQISNDAAGEFMNHFAALPSK